jgi:hypothetical protein
LAVLWRNTVRWHKGKRMMDRAKMMLAAPLAACLFAAMPALATTPPADASMNLPVNNPAPSEPAFNQAEAPLQREAWLAECHRRLGGLQGAPTANIGKTCADWWHYYSNGGAPQVSYGYAIPVQLTPQGPICDEKQVVSYVRPAPKPKPRKAHHDKRIKL